MTSLPPQGHRTLPRSSTKSASSKSADKPQNPPTKNERPTRPTTLTPPADKSSNVANPFRAHNYRYYVRGDYQAFLPKRRGQTLDNEDKTMPSKTINSLNPPDFNGNAAYCTYPGPGSKTPRKSPPKHFVFKTKVDDNLNGLDHIGDYSSHSLPKPLSQGLQNVGESLSSVLDQVRLRHAKSDEIHVPGEGELEELLRSMEILDSVGTPNSKDLTSDTTSSTEPSSSSATTDSGVLSSTSTTSGSFCLKSSSTDSFGTSSSSGVSSSVSSASSSASSSRTSTLSGSSSTGSRQSSLSSSSGRGTSPPSNEESSPSVEPKNSVNIKHQKDIVVDTSKKISNEVEKANDTDKANGSTKAVPQNNLVVDTNKQQILSKISEPSDASLELKAPENYQLNTKESNIPKDSNGMSNAENSAKISESSVKPSKMDTEMKPRFAVIQHTAPMDYIADTVVDLDTLNEGQGQNQGQVTMPEKHEAWLRASAEKRARNKKLELMAAKRRSLSPSKSVQRQDGKISEGTQTRSVGRVYKGSKSDTLVENFDKTTSSQFSPLQKPYSKYRTEKTEQKVERMDISTSASTSVTEMKPVPKTVPKLAPKTAPKTAPKVVPNTAPKTNPKILLRPSLPTLTIPAPPPSSSVPNSPASPLILTFPSPSCDNTKDELVTGEKIVLKTATITTLTTEYLEDEGDMCVELGGEFFQNIDDDNNINAEEEELTTGKLELNTSNIAHKRPAVPSPKVPTPPPKLVTPPPKLLKAPPPPLPTPPSPPESPPCTDPECRSFLTSSSVSPLSPGVPRRPIELLLPPPPPLPPTTPPVNPREVPIMGSLVIPSREQRRVTAKPLMPSINEHGSCSGSSDNDDDDDVEEEELSSAASSLRKTHKRNVSSSSSIVSYDGVKKSRADSDSQESLSISGGETKTSGRTLLDTMHKKYCATQYHQRGSRARSAETLTRRAGSDDSINDSKTMPKPKTKGKIVILLI